LEEEFENFDPEELVLQQSHSYNINFLCAIAFGLSLNQLNTGRKYGKSLFLFIKQWSLEMDRCS
jgi:hypothetical protein